MPLSEEEYVAEIFLNGKKCNRCIFLTAYKTRSIEDYSGSMYYICAKKNRYLGHKFKDDLSHKEVAEPLVPLDFKCKNFLYDSDGDGGHLIITLPLCGRPFLKNYLDGNRLEMLKAIYSKEIYKTEEERAAIKKIFESVKANSKVGDTLNVKGYSTLQSGTRRKASQRSTNRRKGPSDEAATS